MSRSGYTEDCEDQWACIRYRGAVKSAIRGRRGQSFLSELVRALDALPKKRLIAGELQEPSGEVCAIGAVGAARGLDMQTLDPDDAESVAATFGISDALAREVVFENDEGGYLPETPEERYDRMRKWAEGHLSARPGKPAKDGKTRL